MVLKEQISEDIKAAMKAGQSETVSVLRMLMAAFNNMEIEKRVKGEVKEDDYVGVVKKETKKRKEAIEAYKAAGRAEAQRKEEIELEVLSKYLPEEMSESDIKKVVDEVIAERSEDLSNLGMIIGEVVKRTQGRADGGVISKLVRERLG
ncbi:GatB/YqeY domain-containing protein [candidate division Kazan bacterium]|uniref:GatB/YqeY domain-containing protein n=1 Tax=candidate division Kazan bacterium TaxID=2202143 RepID=A0A420ZBJ2_UNCK3|nr:MAG: GatB/YqeY domain-containing protein [candidate division Kazan bacterium]